MAESGKVLSFGFSKKIEKKHISSSVDIDASSHQKKEGDDDDCDLVFSVEKNQIHGSKKETSTKELIIPLIKRNVWRLNESKSEKVNGTDADSLEKQAITELKAEASESQGEGDSAALNVVIPLLMQNKVPDGFETDDKVDVSIRPEQATEADYEQVPIEQYGVAMLKGMGWRPGQPVGARCKQSAAVLEPVLRPKGLGLGANRAGIEEIDGVAKSKKRKPGDKKEEEKLTLGKNSYVQIQSGAHRDLYGQVCGLDSDNHRVIVKLCVSSEMANVSQYSVKCVDRQEYEKYSKYLNKGKVDAYYKDRDEKQRKERERKKESKSNGMHKDSSEMEEVEKMRRKKKQKSTHRHREEWRSSSEDSGDKERATSWLYPNLRVRFIDKSYKQGRYYNKKLVVVDVTSHRRCICESEVKRGEVIENVHISQLETIIPKGDDDVVMILSGPHKHQLARIIHRDKSKCRASVQLVSDIDMIVDKVSYDDLCEYVGTH